jgi:hypothetical protein
LKQLGLQGKDGQGVLGKPKKSHQKKNQSRSKSTTEVIIEQRQRLSRKSKAKEVDYTGDLNLRAMMDADREAQRKAKLERNKNKNSNTKSHDHRVPLFIYQEFQRIRSTRKEHVKQAKRHVREATREIKYWSQQVSFITHREKSQFQREKWLRQQQVEKSVLNGKTQWEILQELDRRLPELQAVVEKYDTQQMSVEEQQRQRQLAMEEWNKKQALDRKLPMIDALEGFPKSMNDAMSTLNALLVSRSPKDPPPPRRSKRSMEEEEENDEQEQERANQKHKKKRAKTNKAPTAASSPKETNVDDSWSNLTASMAAAAAAAARDTSKTTVTSSTVDIADDDATATSNNAATTTKKKKKTRPKDARNIGGWISPLFSQQLDRSWLERTKPLKRINVVPPTTTTTAGKGSAMPVFDLHAYVPQAGDIVLFYPSAYRDFLEVHPDTLGSRMRNLLRVPLWIRARRQLGRLKQRTASDEDQKVVWFTEEWVSSLTGKKGEDAAAAAAPPDNTGMGGGGGVESSSSSAPTLGDYPIICQVVRTHTEFPPDPYSKEKSISKSGKETTISWAQPSAAKLISSKPKAAADRPQVRLAVSLKPLSKVIPPNFDKRSSSPFPSPMAAPGRTTTTTATPFYRAVDSYTEPNCYDDLAMPPTFTILTCPVSAPLEPCIVPFCYAYTMYHSLSLGEPVYIRRAENEEYFKDESKTKRVGKNPLVQGKGRVLGFAAAREGEPMDHMALPHSSGFVDLNDVNPMMGDPLHGVEFGDPLGEDPFGLHDALGSDGFHDVFGGVGMEWQQQHQPQSHQVQQSSVITRSFRLEDRANDLNGLLSKLTANGTLLPQALEEALTADDDTGSIPLREAGIIVDFLSMAQGAIRNNKKDDVDFMPEITTNVSLMEFIQSTLPIRQGVTVSIDSHRRHSHRTSPWHLVPFHPSEYVRNIQDGFIGTLDNATREKAVMGLEDIVENHKPNSQNFYSIVTEDVAPGYYCAVPVAMFFERIFARLKANSGGQCYYSSIESIIMDLTAISENSMLYNDPDSALVVFCNAMILECKKFMVDLSKTSNDVVGKRDSSATAMKKRSTVVIPDDLNAPYKGELHRDWVQRIAPDSFDDTGERQWVPQCGDSILYSRSRHKDFISNHLNSLAEIQCLLPGFKLPAEGELSSVDLEISTMSHWLKGTVVSVRTTFPLAPTGKVQYSFDHPAPILAVEVQLNYTWCKDTVVLFWRPCILPNDVKSSGTKCKSCKLSLESFLQPEWTASKKLKILESDSFPMTVPGTLDEDGASALKRCFDLLMRRALVGIPPAYVNPQEALSLAERNVAIHPGSRSLPSFEDFLVPAVSGKKSTNTRGIKKTEEPGVVATLSNCGFLPQWSLEYLQNTDKKDKHTPKHEALLPCPGLCLELIRLRISLGFYRNAMAVVNDISESYVTSVLFILSGPASRKLNRLSIRKLTKYLASVRGSPKMPKLYYKKKKSLGGNDSVPSQPKSSEPELSEEFTPEETLLIGKISQLRSFHATAIVFATQAMQMERLFCLRAVPVPLPPDLPAIVPVEQNKDYTEEQLEGIAKIRWVLEAIGKDPAQNRLQFANSKRFKLKISCGGQLIAENGELEAMADGVTYFQPSTVIARISEGKVVRLQIKCGDETICGERQPVANPLENVGWPLPLSGAQPISLDNIRDGISLGFQHFENNDGLTRALLGLPGRRFACVRCQSKGLSALQCRVRKGHSNLDFSIIEHFQGTIGVDSLFLPWKSDHDTNAQLTAAHVDEEEKVDLQEVEEEKEAKVKALEEEEKKAEATREQRAKEAEENLAKAKSALKTAQYLSVQAHRLNELEAKLSDEFIRDYFPVDPEDNHYVFCIHCGTA